MKATTVLVLLGAAAAVGLAWYAAERRATFTPDQLANLRFWRWRYQQAPDLANGTIEPGG